MAPETGDATRLAYDKLAPFYDDFVRDYDHAAWAASLERLARRHGLRGGRALDLACGTGKSLAPLFSRGYDAIGCDFSPRMLQRARAALPAAARLIQADMRALPRLGSFDLVWCLSDGLNYVAAADLPAVFAGVADNLRRNGVVVFDLNTLWCYRRFFAATAVVSAPDQVLVWQGQGDGSASAGVHAAATLTAYVRSDGPFWSRVTTEHRQQHHPERTVRDALRSAGLDLVGAYGARLDGSVRMGVDESADTKAVYVARHVAPGKEGR